MAYAKSPVDHCWYEFDDMMVTKKTESELAQMEAYVLFYRRNVSNKKETERRRILELIQSPSSQNQTLCLLSKLWLTKWMFCTFPGPIDNAPYLCEHHAVNTRKFRNYSELMIQIPEHVYRQLVTSYGSDLNEPLREFSPCQKCEDYEKSLNLRRQLEEKEVAALDVTILPPGHFWYLIHSDWLRAWHEFKHDGALPGPISNHVLLDEYSQPLRNLRKALHYRGVSKQVWDYLHHRYGGGPVIIRESIDIYTVPPETPIDGMIHEKLPDPQT